MRIFFILLITLFSSIYSRAQLSPSQVISDIEQLQELIEFKHVRPFWKISQEDFQATIAKAKDIISNKNDCDEACLVELYKIIASIRDGHSSVISRSRYEHFGYLPFTARSFKDGFYIVKVSKEYEDVLGHKIEAINGVDISVVLKELGSVVPHANESRFKKFAGSYLHLPGLLYGLGITRDPKIAVITFSKGDTKFEREIYNMTPEIEKEAEFVSFLDGKDDLPLFQRNRDLYYWYEYDDNEKLLYFQYNRIGNMESESSSEFAERLWSTVDSVEIKKFVLDLRYNGGGSFPYSLKFIQGILDRPEVFQNGNLYVITGYETFSAAILMLNQLESKSRAFIIGEPPCDHPASPGDSESFTLDATKTRVNLSSLFHPTIFKNDQRISTLLDNEISTTWSDYERGFDPVLSFVFNHEQNKREIAEPKNYVQYLGKYDYSPTRNIQLKEINNGLWFEIDHALSTPLYVNENGTFETEIVGLSVELNDSKFILQFPDGSFNRFSRIDATNTSPIESIYRGDFSKAEKEYLDIKQRNSDFIELQDHQMSFLASIIYFDLKDNPEVDASAIAKKILNLGIKLNEGNAPFCEFSLRFY